jgi:hypothetical protein
MRRSLISRIEALEAQVDSAPPAWLRTAWLSAVLPPGYDGERHYVVVKSEPTVSPSIAWCEFEERAGPTPNKSARYPLTSFCCGNIKNRDHASVDPRGSPLHRHKCRRQRLRSIQMTVRRKRTIIQGSYPECG